MLAEQQDRKVRMGWRICRAARAPSVVMVGGIRTSMIANSGRCSATASISAPASPTDATISWPASDQQACESFAEQCRVLGDQDAHQILTLISVPAPAVLASESSPPTDEIRSRTDVSPNPVRCSADPVIGDFHVYGFAALLNVDLDRGRVGVFECVGECLRHDEVDGGRDDLCRYDVGDGHVHRHRAVGHQSYQRRGESVFQAARSHAVGEPAQVGNGIGEGDDGRLKIIVGALSPDRALVARIVAASRPR